jgi:hypothetical protein
MTNQIYKFKIVLSIALPILQHVKYVFYRLWNILSLLKNISNLFEIFTIQYTTIDAIRCI